MGIEFSVSFQPHPNLNFSFFRLSIKNYMLNGGLVIFDYGFKDRYKLINFNIHLAQIIDSLKIPSDCGLKIFQRFIITWPILIWLKGYGYTENF
jgi:hypothetical protein